MTASDPFEAALRLLSARDRSTHELRSRLLRKGCTESAVEAAIGRCRELGYLDDRRFARERARTLLRSGRAVGFRLKAELQRHGISEDLALHICEELGEEICESDLLAELAQRRFPGFDMLQADAREKRRVIHFFLRRGFSTAQILDFFHAER